MPVLFIPRHTSRVSRRTIARFVVLVLPWFVLSSAPQAGAPEEPAARSTATPGNSLSNNGAKVTELKKIDVKQGTGAEATSRKAVLVHYTGWLYDPTAPDQRGRKFDSSLDRGLPFGFIVGAGRVIRGWDEGVLGMRVGGKRTLIIPPELGYGARGAGNVIPPNATLIFDVELVDIRN